MIRKRLLALAGRNDSELDVAVRRLDDGTYGRCASCGDAIGFLRMQDSPAEDACEACRQDENLA